MDAAELRSWAGRLRDMRTRMGPHAPSDGKGAYLGDGMPHPVQLRSEPLADALEELAGLLEKPPEA